MEIAKLSTAVSHAEVKQQASLAVMNSALGQLETQGAGMQELLDSSKVNEAPHPTKGASIDLKG
ncbi:hypothetical protein N781_01560 [Pontibacillus halophilus JSM 076056 = DSM 19796]|uniref:Motility protein n=1 Tax=Pontibacillus halophilus JSM 076056 = DSM 19796 TaxID=1385510 RepID=A0A0A5GKV7_9BACI|nr:hypothetical protein N781_01560 [Pontibacillus halophilus JSM 076056 = DSM 19796]